MSSKSEGFPGKIQHLMHKCDPINTLDVGALIRVIGPKNPSFLPIWQVVGADLNLHYLRSVPTLLPCKATTLYEKNRKPASAPTLFLTSKVGTDLVSKLGQESYKFLPKNLITCVNTDPVVNSKRAITNF